MDLSKLSDADLLALRSGDLTKVSDDGLRALRGEPEKSKTLYNRAQDVAAGLLRGAGSIGATLLTPADKAASALGIENSFLGRSDRRQAMTDALRELGFDTESLEFKGGKLASEVAGTAGVGGVLAKGAQAAKVAPAVVKALQTGGFSTGAAPASLLARAGDIGLRSAARGVVGGASAGLVDPGSVGAGSLIGAALPPALKFAGAAGQAAGSGIKRAGQSVAERLMQSAIKPTLSQLKKGEAKTAAQTLLELGINPTKKGAEKLRMMVDDVNTQIADEIAGSTASIDKQSVLQRLNDTRRTFGQQVAPQGDLAAIQKVGDDFLSHPGFPQNDIPVQIAQKMKQGTYRTLADKYGQIGSAETEASKALARGLKEEISAAVPAVAGLNAQEAKLITTLKVTERRALMEMNKNPMGLAALAQNPWSWAMFMADKSALFKSLAARMLNSASQAPNAAQRALSTPGLEQMVYRVAPVAAADQ